MAPSAPSDRRPAGEAAPPSSSSAAAAKPSAATSGSAHNHHNSFLTPPYTNAVPVFSRPNPIAPSSSAYLSQHHQDHLHTHIHDHDQLHNHHHLRHPGTSPRPGSGPLTDRDGDMVMSDVGPDTDSYRRGNAALISPERTPPLPHARLRHQSVSVGGGNGKDGSLAAPHAPGDARAPRSRHSAYSSTPAPVPSAVRDRPLPSFDHLIRSQQAERAGSTSCPPSNGSTSCNSPALAAAAPAPAPATSAAAAGPMYVPGVISSAPASSSSTAVAVAASVPVPGQFASHKRHRDDQPRAPTYSPYGRMNLYELVRSGDPEVRDNLRKGLRQITDLLKTRAERDRVRQQEAAAAAAAAAADDVAAAERVNGIGLVSGSAPDPLDRATPVPAAATVTATAGSRRLVAKTTGAAANAASAAGGAATVTTTPTRPRASVPASGSRTRRKEPSHDPLGPETAASKVRKRPSRAKNASATAAATANASAKPASPPVPAATAVAGGADTAATPAITAIATPKISPARIGPHGTGSPTPVSPTTGLQKPRAPSTREDRDFETIPDMCPPVTAEIDSKSFKTDWKGQPLDLSSDPHRHLLHPAEVGVASTLRLSCAVYLTSKRRIFQARVEAFRKSKEFRKTDAQQACNIDVNKASKLWTAFDKVGWFNRDHFAHLLDQN